MSELVCIAYSGEDTADKVLGDLKGLAREKLIELEDACVVTHDQDGDMHLKQALPLVRIGAAGGAATGMLWGGLIGLLFLNPLAGLAVGGVVGAGTGALSGSMSDYGIDDKFIKELGANIPRGSSALFLLIRKVTADKVVPKIAHYGGTVLRSSLSNEQEAKLREALGHAATTSPSPSTA